MDKLKKTKGFTLIEVVVSMSLFIFIFSAVAVITQKAVYSFGSVKKIDQNMQDVQHSMNLMAKVIRTSSIDPSGGSGEIRAYDYSQGKCVIFRHDPVAKSLRTASEEKPNMDDCNFGAMAASLTDLISEIVEGVDFEAVISDETVPRLGKVKIFLTLKRGTETVHIQSSVSLRDYVNFGVYFE